MLHGFPEHDTVIGESGHIGRGAAIHRCAIRPNALVGINAVIMDDAVVGEAAIVAACAFVTAGLEIPARTLAAGAPAKVLRALSEQEMNWKSEGTRTCQNPTRRCLATMRATEPLAAPEDARARIAMPEVIPLSELKAGTPLCRQVHRDGRRRPTPAAGTSARPHRASSLCRRPRAIHGPRQA